MKTSNIGIGRGPDSGHPVSGSGKVWRVLGVNSDLPSLFGLFILRGAQGEGRRKKDSARPEDVRDA